MKYYNRNRSRGFSQIETNAIRQNASFFWSSAWFACRLPVVYQFFRYISGIFLFHLTVEFLLGGCFVGSWSTDFYPVSQRRRRRRTSHVVSRGATLTANPNQPDRTKIGVWQFQEFELIFGLVALILLIRKIFNNPWKLLKNSRKLPWKVPNSTGKILWNGRIYIWISFRWYLVGKSFKNCWNCLGKCKNLPNSTGKILFVGIWLENPSKMLKKWQILSWKMQKSAKWWKIDENWPNLISKIVKNGEKLKKKLSPKLRKSSKMRQECRKNRKIWFSCVCYRRVVRDVTGVTSLRECLFPRRRCGNAASAFKVAAKPRPHSIIATFNWFLRRIYNRSNYNQIR